MPPPPQRLAQTLVCLIQAFPAIGHGLSGSKTQCSQITGVLERSFLDRQTFWNKAFGVEELAEDLAPCGESHEDAARPDHDSGQAVRPISGGVQCPSEPATVTCALCRPEEVSFLSVEVEDLQPAMVPGAPQIRPARIGDGSQCLPFGALWPADAGFEM